VQDECRPCVQKAGIEGAQRVGHQWIIPADAPKPKDARVKSGKYIKSKNENGEDIDEQKTI